VYFALKFGGKIQPYWIVFEDDFIDKLIVA